MQPKYCRARSFTLFHGGCENPSMTFDVYGTVAPQTVDLIFGFSNHHCPAVSSPVRAKSSLALAGTLPIACERLPVPGRGVELRIPALTGTIKRRLLVNFRADPEVVQRLLPEPFTPKLQGEHALVGMCLIRFEHERPSGIPEIFGASSENAAHRFAVQWTDEAGVARTGVYISRRHTNSSINKLAGDRLLGIEHGMARFTVSDIDGNIDFDLRSRNNDFMIRVKGHETEVFPADSCFDSLQAAADFFEAGSLGYSPKPARSNGVIRPLSGLELTMPIWKVGAFEATEARSSYFEDAAQFPAGSIAYDHTLIMRDLRHEWRSTDELAGTPRQEG